MNEGKFLVEAFNEIGERAVEGTATQPPSLGEWDDYPEDLQRTFDVIAILFLRKLLQSRDRDRS